MTDDFQEKGKQWRRREKWCRCTSPLREELETAVALLIEGELSIDECLEQLHGSLELHLICLRSLSASDLLVHDMVNSLVDNEDDIRIAYEFVRRVSRLGANGPAERQLVFRGVLERHRRSERSP